MTLVQRWLKNLRSGEFAQVTGVLHDGTGFCCLGVACSTQDPEGWAQNKDALSYNYNTWEHDLGDGDGTELDQEFLHSLGLRDDEMATLIKMNDGHGQSTERHTFKQLADFIEALNLDDRIAKQ